MSQNTSSVTPFLASHDVLICVGASGKPHFSRRVGMCYVELMWCGSEHGGWTVTEWDVTSDGGEDMDWVDGHVFGDDLEGAVVAFVKCVQGLA